MQIFNPASFITPTEARLTALEREVRAFDIDGTTWTMGVRIMAGQPMPFPTEPEGTLLANRDSGNLVEVGVRDAGGVRTFFPKDTGVAGDRPDAFVRDESTGVTYRLGCRNVAGQPTFFLYT